METTSPSAPEPLRDLLPRTSSAQQSEPDLSSCITPLIGRPACPVCLGTGWLRVERDLTDPRFGKLEPCECQADRGLGRLRELSGLHGAELSVQLADVSPEMGPGTREMVEACRGFIQQPGGFLTIWGGVGVGKTSCLYAITNALLRRGAVYVSLHDLLEFVRGAFNARGDNGDDANARLKRFATVPVLCLDEMDKVKPSEWVTEQLTALVDARFRSALGRETGTVMALNSDPRLQPAWIASRLQDGRNRVVHNADKDARPFMREF